MLPACQWGSISTTPQDQDRVAEHVPLYRLAFGSDSAGAHLAEKRLNRRLPDAEYCHRSLRCKALEAALQAVSQVRPEDKTEELAVLTRRYSGVRVLGPVRRGCYLRGSKRTSTSVPTVTGWPPWTGG